VVPNPLPGYHPLFLLQGHRQLSGPMDGIEAKAFRGISMLKSEGRNSRNGKRVQTLELVETWPRSNWKKQPEHIDQACTV